MSGKHDKSVDEDQSANLLMTGPIVIRGLGRSVKDAFRPGRPSRHRAFVGEEAGAEPLAVEQAAQLEPSDEITYEVEGLFPSEAEVAQTDASTGPQEDRVDDRADDAPPADTDVEQPWDGSGERSAEDAAPDALAEESEDRAPADERDSDDVSRSVDDSEDHGSVPSEGDEGSDERLPEDPAGALDDGVEIESGESQRGSEEIDEPTEDARSADSEAREVPAESASEAPVLDRDDGEPTPQEAPLGGDQESEARESTEFDARESTEEVDGVSSDESPPPADAAAEEPAAGDQHLEPDGEVGTSDGVEPADSSDEHEQLPHPAGDARPADETEEAGDVAEASADEHDGAPDGQTDGEVVAEESDSPSEELPPPSASVETDSTPAELASNAVFEPEQDQQGVGAEAAGAQAETVGVSDRTAPEDSLDDWFVPAAGDGAESGATSDGGQTTSDGTVEDDGPEIDHTASIAAAEPDGAKSDTFDAADAEATDEPRGEQEEEPGPDGAESDTISVVDPEATVEPKVEQEQDPASGGSATEESWSNDASTADGAAAQTDDVSAEDVLPGDGASDQSDPGAEESPAGPEDRDELHGEETFGSPGSAGDENDDHAAGEGRADAHPAGEPLESEGDGAEAQEGEPEGGIDALLGDDPAAADVAEGEQPPHESDAEPAAHDDSALSEYLGQREWTTAEELYSRPIGRSAQQDEPAPEVVESLPDEDRPAGFDDSREPVTDEAAGAGAEPSDEGPFAEPAAEDAPAVGGVADGDAVEELAAADGPAVDGESDGDAVDELAAADNPAVDGESDGDAVDEPAAEDAPSADSEPDGGRLDEPAAGDPPAAVDEPAETVSGTEPVAPIAAATTAAPKTVSRPPRGPRRPRPMRERFGREAIGIAVLVVLALICGGLITAVVLKTQNDARIAAAEAAHYTPPPLTTPTPAATGPVVAVIGDGSVSTAAAGVTSAGKWTALVGTDLSGTVTTDASNGMGYAAKGSSGETFVQAASTVPSNADVVVIFGGAADANIAPLSLAKAATDAMSAAKQQAPNAKILVVGPVISAGVGDADLAAIRNTLKSAAGIVKATWIDPIDRSWLSSSEEAASSPSALTGADEKTIASKMAAAITSALH